MDWIRFGISMKILADNDGAFANMECRDMCENLNIDVKHTAADSPMQNGLWERNNAVINLKFNGYSYERR